MSDFCDYTIEFLLQDGRTISYTTRGASKLHALQIARHCLVSDGYSAHQVKYEAIAEVPRGTA